MRLPNDTVRAFHARLCERKSPATADSYCGAVILWLKFLAEKRITDLSKCHPGLLDDFVAWMLRDHSVITSKARMTGVLAFLEFQRRAGDTIPIFAKPDFPRVPERKEPRVLTLDELSSYFDRATEFEEPVRTALLLMPLCGLRSDETVRLQLDSMKVKDGWVILSFRGKGQKLREVPLLKQGNGILRAYLTGWRAQYKLPNPWMFPGHFRGKHLTTRTLRKWAGVISEELQIPELSPHTLRKTYSTILDQMGVSPLQIAQLLGHANLNTTNRHYIKHEVGTLMSSLTKVSMPSPFT